MSSLEKRLAVFRKLPLRAQLTSDPASPKGARERASVVTIVSSKANKTLGQNKAYIASLEQVHSSCLVNATVEEKLAYDKYFKLSLE